MATALEQLLDSPENLEYLARQSRQLSLSPLRLFEIAQEIHSELRLSAPSFHTLLKSLAEDIERRRPEYQLSLFEWTQEMQSESSPAKPCIQRLLDSLTEDLKRRRVEPQTSLPEETAYDAAKRLGIIGLVNSPHNDLSTNPKHLEGFGR